MSETQYVFILVGLGIAYANRNPNISYNLSIASQFSFNFSPPWVALGSRSAGTCVPLASHNLLRGTESVDFPAR